MRWRIFAAVLAGFALGAGAAFALSLVGRRPGFDPTGYQLPPEAD
jgi:hypothetical protein